MTSQTTSVSRMKRKHRKTRTGCVTCKSRRVKCDEGKPVCDNCSSLGRKCIYQPVMYSLPSINSERFATGPLPHLALSPIERTAETTQLQQFCMSTSLAVFKNLGRPFEIFWTSAVPSLSYCEPCVAHITIALAARQRASFYVQDASNERGHLVKTYGKHYGDALRLLSHSDSYDRPEIILLCCLLFISMENVQDTMSNSFLHLRSGLQVLRQWKVARASESPGLNYSSDSLIENTLEPMFARFEAAVSPSIYANGHSDSEVSLNWPVPEVPDRFENLATARGALYEMAQWVFSQGHHQMVFHTPYSPELVNTLDLCAKWKRVLNFYKEEKPIEARKYEVSILALDTNHKLLMLLIMCTTYPNEMLWVRHSGTLEEMLLVTERLDSVTDVPQRRGKMNLLPRMLPALFTIAIICRRKASRQRALDMIKKIHEDNHPEDQCFVAVIAEGVIRLEEWLEQKAHSQLSSNVTRVRPLVAKLVPAEGNQPGKIVLTYTRPFMHAFVADDPDLGLITKASREQTIDLEWNSHTAPPARNVWLWPPIEFLRLSGSSGLVGPNTGHCLCKTYGALFALMRSVESVYNNLTT